MDPLPRVERVADRIARSVPIRESWVLECAWLTRQFCHVEALVALSGNPRRSDELEIARSMSLRNLRRRCRMAEVGCRFNHRLLIRERLLCSQELTLALATVIGRDARSQRCQ